MRTVIRTIEARFPGSRVIVEPFGVPEDPEIRWILRVLNVREKDTPLVLDFGIDLAIDLYGKMPIPFSLSPMGPRGTARFLSLRRRAEDAEKIGRPPGQRRRFVPRKPAASGRGERSG